MNFCLVLLLIINHFVFLVAFVLFCFNPMNTLNYNHIFTFIVFLVMTLSIKVIVVMILLLNVLAYLVMSHSGSIGSLVAWSLFRFS